MSYTELDRPAPRAALLRGTFLPAVGRLARVALWSVLNVGLLFAETFAELLAPILLIVGGIWWVIPRVLASISLDGQAADLLAVARAHFPHDVYLNGSWYSGSVLMTDGVWMIAVVAVCRTLSMALAALLLDRR